jgi:uncharacterized membrane protein
MNFIPTAIVLCAIPIPVILYSVTSWMWLEPGNGEANYVFFQCLAYNILIAILLLSFCSASLRHDKALRMTEKQMNETTARTTDVLLTTSIRDPDQVVLEMDKKLE